MRNLESVLVDLLEKVEGLFVNETKNGYLNGIKAVYVGEKLDKSVVDPSLILYLGNVSVNAAYTTGGTETFDIELLILSNFKNTNRNGYVQSVTSVIKARELLLNNRSLIPEMRTVRSGDIDPTSMSKLQDGKGYNALGSVIVTVMVRNVL